LNRIDAVGEIIARSVAKWFQDDRNRKLIERLREAGLNLKSELHQPAGAARALSGKTFVLTGTLPSLTRQQATAMIEALGGRVSGSVSQKTDYVVVGGEAGSKLEKARKLGLETLDETGLRSLCERHP
jgi:DNA ligase (NAD+)